MSAGEDEQEEDAGDEEERDHDRASHARIVVVQRATASVAIRTRPRLGPSGRPGPPPVARWRPASWETVTNRKPRARNAGTRRPTRETVCERSPPPSWRSTMPPRDALRRRGGDDRVDPGRRQSSPS
jgi:hypothetical protein